MAAHCGKILLELPGVVVARGENQLEFLAGRFQLVVGFRQCRREGWPNQ